MCNVLNGFWGYWLVWVVFMIIGVTNFLIGKYVGHRDRLFHCMDCGYEMKVRKIRCGECVKIAEGIDE